MEQIDKVILKDKEITDQNLINLIVSCLVETGGIQHVSKNLSELGYPDFNTKTYSQLEKSKQTQVLNFNDFSANHFLVICIVIFVTVKEVEGDILVQTSFDEGMRLFRNI